jgi:hypothetical protein
MSVEQASRLVLDAIAAGEQPDPEASWLVWRAVRLHARRMFPRLDADEIAQETFSGLLEHPQVVARQPIKMPWAYIKQAAVNRAVSLYRSPGSKRTVELDEAVAHGTSEDWVGRLLDQNASHEAVHAAMRRAIEHQDSTTVPVISVWLDMAEELGKAPSTRQVAERAGVSHTTVATAIRRFRALVSDVGPPTAS